MSDLIRSVSAVVATCVLAALVCPPAHAAPITITHGATSLTLDFTAINAAGNAADNTGFGSVAYDYDIMTYEITTDQYNTVANATAVPTANAWAGDQPAAGIRYYEAAMFANWLTSGDVTQGAYDISAPNVTIDRASALATYGEVYVIPTDDEWYKAAYYDPINDIYVDYATGSDTAPTPTTGSTAADEAVYRIAQELSPAPVVPADVDNAGGTSLFGTMGQSGNIAEYVEMVLSDTTPAHRGGHYSDGGSTNLSSAGRGSNPSAFSNPQTVGLRMVRVVPEPGTMTLLAAGAAALFVRRQRNES